MDISLLFGGRSTEHQFSIDMFEHFATHLADADDERVRVRQAIYVDLNGFVHQHKIENQGHLLSLIKNPTVSDPLPMSDLPLALTGDGHFVFSLIQGREGEDGQYQGMADLLDIPGNFGPVLPAAVGIDKWTFGVLANHVAGGVLTPIPTKMLDTVAASDAEIEEIAKAFQGAECVLKPNSLNGSLFTHVTPSLTPTLLREYLDEVREFDDRILVQRRIRGRELTCACLRVNGHVQTLPVGEVVTSGEVFSYETKYGRGGYSVSFPDPKGHEIEEISRVSVVLAQFLRVHTLCRFDFLVDENNLYLLEVNPCPGLLFHSIVPRMLRRAGMSIVDLIVHSAENDEKYRASRSSRNQRLAGWSPVESALTRPRKSIAAE